MLNVAIQAIRKAGNFIIQQYEFINHSNLYLSSEYIEIFISKIHTESQKIISTIIRKFYPTHIINTNKKNVVQNTQSNDIQWIIESIDNNTNFIKQFPFFTLSIAVQYKKHIKIGVIYDPIHNELFSACKGKGAQCNGYRIRLNHNNIHNTTKNLNTAILAIAYSHYTDTSIIINILHELNKQYTIVDFRRTGSIMLDLAYVATGRVDGCLIISLKDTKKLASAILIIKESGGLIFDFNGNELCYLTLTNNIIAGNSKIIKTILPLTKQYQQHTKFKLI